jgi:thiamine pyrophosphate-dependent acetolactate synthase large subunit-like protein
MDLDTMAEDISEAFYYSRTRKCPVIISLPAKYWEGELDWSWNYQPSSQFVVTQQEPEQRAVDRVADMMVAAERPVIIAGRGAVLAGARAEIERLGDMAGALMATSLLGKGFFDGHPYDVGISGSYSSNPTEKLMAEADFVLGIGASMNFFTTEGGMLFPSAKVARIDIKPYPNDIGIVPGEYIRGDAKLGTLALIKVLERSGVQKEGYRTAQTRELLKVAPIPDRRSDGIDQRELMHVLSTCLPENAQVITDAGMFWNWPHAYLALPRGARYQHTCNFGSVGLGLSQGIGAAIGSPDRVTVVITGDGGLLQCIQELHVAAQYKVPIVVLIMNDAGYGAEVHKMNASGKNPRDVVWDSPDFVAVARGFGGDGSLITESKALPDAFGKAIKSGGPYVIDARISPSLTGDYYQRIYLGRENPTPLLRPQVAEHA